MISDPADCVFYHKVKSHCFSLFDSGVYLEVNVAGHMLCNFLTYFCNEDSYYEEVLHEFIFAL